MNTDTPRTDETEAIAANFWNSTPVVLADFARQLERELNGAKDLIDTILKVIPEDAPCQVIATGETIADYILDLQREVEKAHKLYFDSHAREAQLRAALESLAEYHNVGLHFPEVAEDLDGMTLAQYVNQSLTLPSPSVVPVEDVKNNV